MGGYKDIWVDKGYIEGYNGIWMGTMIYGWIHGDIDGYKDIWVDTMIYLGGYKGIWVDTRVYGGIQG